MPLYPGEAMYGAGSGFENVTPSQMYTPGGAGGGGGGGGEIAGVGGSNAAGGGGGGASSGPDSVAGRGRVYSLSIHTTSITSLNSSCFSSFTTNKKGRIFFPPSVMP